MPGSKWIQAATDNDEDDRQKGKGSFRRIGRKARKGEEPDRDDQPTKKKKRPGIVDAMNEPQMV